MFTAAHVKRHIARLQEGQIFTSREFLSYGTRAAIDQALYRLVKSGYIRRLARGVFIVPQAGARSPTPLEVAAAKARAFAKHIFQHGAEAGKMLGILAEGNREITYSTNGPSSSFRYGNIVIHFKRSAPRKIACGDTAVGLVIRALWHIGKRGHTSALSRAASSGLGRTERGELRQHAGLMPQWMSRSWLAQWTKPRNEGWNKRQGKDERKSWSQR